MRLKNFCGVPRLFLRKDQNILISFSEMPTSYFFGKVKPSHIEYY